MLQTVRHEGFHQYLDRLVSNPPVWFNEGLAEYFEMRDARERESWRRRERHPRHSEFLESATLLPLVDFLFETHGRLLRQHREPLRPGLGARDLPAPLDSREQAVLPEALVGCCAKNVGAHAAITAHLHAARHGPARSRARGLGRGRGAESAPVAGSSVLVYPPRPRRAHRPRPVQHPEESFAMRSALAVFAAVFSIAVSVVRAQAPGRRGPARIRWDVLRARRRTLPRGRDDRGRGGPNGARAVGGHAAARDASPPPRVRAVLRSAAGAAGPSPGCLLHQDAADREAAQGQARALGHGAVGQRRLGPGRDARRGRRRTAPTTGSRPRSTRSTARRTTSSPPRRSEARPGGTTSST